MKQYDFNWDNINKAPNEHGVYILYKNDKITYIGRAAGSGVTIRTRLADHKNGKAGKCTQLAEKYSREITENAVNRERELLEWHISNFRRLPACNDLIP